MSLCKGWRQMRVVAPPTWSCTQRKGGRRCPFSPASYNIAIVALLGGVCSSKQLRVASRFWADATNQTPSPESLRARRQRLAPTRCYGSGRWALPHPACLAARAARAKPADRAAVSVWSSEARSTRPKRQMDNIMYLYEQLGPPDDAPKATAAAEDRRWWSDWVAWPGVGATEDGACRGTAARDLGRRGRPRRPTRYSLRQMRRNAARDFAGRSSRRRSASTSTSAGPRRVVSPSASRTGTRASRCPNRARAATRPRPVLRR